MAGRKKTQKNMGGIQVEPQNETDVFSCAVSGSRSQTLNSPERCELGLSPSAVLSVIPPE